MIPRNSKPDNKTDNIKEQQSGENENVKAAHQQAEKDIEQDADLSIHSPNDDLDEGESARLGKDKTDVV